MHTDTIVVVLSQQNLSILLLFILLPIWSGPVQSQELKLMSLVGPF